MTMGQTNERKSFTELEHLVIRVVAFILLPIATMKLITVEWWDCYLAHRSLQSQKHPIVDRARIVDPIFGQDQRSRQRTRSALPSGARAVDSRPCAKSDRRPRTRGVRAHVRGA